MTKILVIEDWPATREFMVDSLGFENYEVLTADNGIDGLRVAQEHMPDLILCDIVMPKLDGYGVLDRLRQNPLTATIPFIFTSAKGDRSDLRQGMELGADDYLSKPFSSVELLAAVRTRLEKRAAIAKRLEQKFDTTRDNTASPVQNEVRQPFAEMRPIMLVIGAETITLPASESILVGRASDDGSMPQPDIDLNPFSAESNGVSRRHIMITRKGTNAYVVDLDSKNGTYLNERRVPSNIEARLNNNDTLRLGNLKIEVRI